MIALASGVLLQVEGDEDIDGGSEGRLVWWSWLCLYLKGGSWLPGVDLRV